LQNLHKEVSLARNIAKKYPQLFKEYTPQLIKAAQQGVAQTANVITTLGTKVEQAATEPSRQQPTKQSTKQTKGRIIKGGLR